MRTPRRIRAGQKIAFLRVNPSRPKVVATTTDSGDAKRLFWWLSACLTAWVLASAAALAQLPQTRLYAVFPPGGQAGTSTEITITRGDDLEDVQQLRFSHPGITAAPKTTTDAAGKVTPVPNQFTVNIAADVPTGHHDVSVAGHFGVSNPRTFVVGTTTELAETEPNNTREQASVFQPGQTINGRINGATDIDFLKFTGTPGQRILFDCEAQRIDSRLDAALEIQDASGRRLAAAHNSRAGDAVLDFTVPAAGEYFLKINDFVYAGGEDYFYRLTARTAPYIDYVIPAAGVPGTTSQFTLYGRNLPQGEATDLKIDGHPLQKQVVDIAIPADVTSPPTAAYVAPFAASVDAFPFTLNTPSGSSNTVLIGFAGTASVTEVEPNNLPAAAQTLAVPGDVTGQFQQRGDVDLYQFEAKAGEVVWLEVLGQRLGTGCDPYLTIDQVVVNDKGEETLKRLAAVDDDGQNPLPIIFDTLHDDPAYRFAAPADGRYRVAVRDRYGAGRGAANLVYHLTLRREAPDFRLVVVTDSPTPPNTKNPQTWSVGLRRGDQFPVWVVVLRRDGFAANVDVAVEGLPAGITCREISVGTTPSQSLLVFETAEDAAPWAGTVKVVGKARLSDAAKDAAVAAALAAVKPANDAVAAAAAAITQPAAAQTQAEAELAAAQQELAAKTDDEALKLKVADASNKVTAAKTAHEAVLAAKAAADQKLAETNKAVADAQTAVAAAAQELVRPARYGTIAWAGGANIPGRGRLAQQLELSVLPENAPFQVKTSVHRVVANHGRQILIPVTAVRREGFDADIPLTFVGQPQNVQVENKPVKKGSAEEVYRVFVPANAPVGTYTMYLAAQAQVSYRRLPAKADQAKAELDAADKAANEAVEAHKVSVTKRDEAVTQVTAAQADLKLKTEAKTAADQALLNAQAAEKAATDAVSAAGEDANAKTEAEKKLVEAQAAVKTATEAVAAALQAQVDADAKVKAAEATKVTAEQDVQNADAKVKATAAEKAAADKRFKDADAVAKPKNLNFLPTTTPIILTIKPAPYTLTATPGDGGNLKRGGKIEVKVAVKRQNNFAGPVTLNLELPPGITGVQAAPVTIPADQSEGVLTLEANGEATEGALANVVVRAASEFDGEALVDQPVTITVAK